MRALGAALYTVAVTLWVGSQWAIGYLAAPALFSDLAHDHRLAGDLAGTLFAAEAWTGMACAAYLLIYVLAVRGLTALKGPVFWLVLLMLALTLAQHFGIQPILAQLKHDALPREVMQSLMRERFETWHGIASVLYLVQSGFGLWLALVQERGKA